MNVSMRKFGALFAVASGLAGVPVAQAAPPTITPAPAEDYVDTTCGFPVSVHFTANGETMKTFSDGTVLITGPLKADFSASGRTVSLNLSGPTSIRPSGDSVTILGHGVGAGPVDTADGQTLAYVAGQVTVSPDGAGVLQDGTMLLDLCQALAG
jgi:archaellum component FlaF (FlaF/FlaG flagellin family)